MTQRVLVVSHLVRAAARAATRTTLQAIEREGLSAVVATETTRAEDVRDVDLAVVLGGDGTILRAAELTRGTGVPMLGVNLGHVGFLAESEPEDIGEAVHRLATGDFAVEERATLDAVVHRPDGTDAIDWALNEVGVERTDPLKMIEVVVEVDGRPLSSFGCDGILAATSTGSTAHAFSAGGPVVWPDVEAMLLVPLLAHALFARPLVLGPASRLAVELLERSASPAVLSCDGRRSTPVPSGSRVEITRGALPVRFARLSLAPFTDRLVHKFDLPVAGWRGRTTGQPGPAALVPPGTGDGRGHQPDERG